MRMYSLPRNDRTKHPLYDVWSGMIARCEYPAHASYRNYGALGVQVCERWRLSFDAFLADMGDRPSKKHSLDRIDGSLGYQPGNVKWSTRKEQIDNRRNTRKVTIDGVSMPLDAAAIAFGVGLTTLIGRYKRGLTDRQIVGLDPLPGPLFGSTPAKLEYWARRRDAWDARTHCPHGHEMSAANELWDNGSRKCRACHNERRRVKKP